METTANRNLASIIHLSVFSKFIIPFGNYFIPLILWGITRERSNYVNEQGRQVINFQLSVLVYYIFLLIITVPVLLYTLFSGVDTSVWEISNLEIIESTIRQSITIQGVSSFIISLIVFVSIFALISLTEFILTILGAIKSVRGENFKYPLTISFIKQ